MFIRWFLAIIFSLQVFTALAADPIDFGTATPAEIRAYNLKRQQEYIEKTDKSFADLGKKIDQVKASYNAPHIKQTLEKSGILSDGSKVQIKTVVTKPADKAKVAQVLTERLKNAKDYAKNLGKASIPSFVGMAAFHGLMAGIDYVMGEGGNVNRPLSNDELKYSSPLTFKPYDTFYGNFTAYSHSSACSKLTTLQNNKYPNEKLTYSVYMNGSQYSCKSSSGSLSVLITNSNPSYIPGSPTTKELTPQEIELALKNALDSNNSALAAATAEAIKAAYSFDGSEGQKPSSNTLAKEAADDMAVALPKAFDNPVPTSNPERPSGYYKITDGDKTVEGYVTPAPIGGTTDTTTTPTIDPVTGQPTGGTSTTGGFQLPAFCDWAAVVCDFIDWVKSDEELPEDKQPNVDTSLFDRKFDFSFNASAQCPPNPVWNFTFINQEWSKELDITMICQMFRWLGFAINIASNMTALWIVYSAVVVRDKA